MYMINNIPIKEAWKASMWFDFYKHYKITVQLIKNYKLDYYYITFDKIYVPLDDKLHNIKIIDSYINPIDLLSEFKSYV